MTRVEALEIANDIAFRNKITFTTADDVQAFAEAIFKAYEAGYDKGYDSAQDNYNGLDTWEW